MVTTPMMTTGSVDLPSSGAAPSKPDKYVKVQIEDDGALSVFDINGKEKKIKGMKELKGELASLKSSADKTPVLIAGDKETSTKTLLMCWMKSSGPAFRRLHWKQAANSRHDPRTA